jgi:hypothetical protein
MMNEFYLDFFFDFRKKVSPCRAVSDPSFFFFEPVLIQMNIKRMNKKVLMISMHTFYHPPSFAPQSNC